jgi:hypothetical protein
VSGSPNPTFFLQNSAEFPFFCDYMLKGPFHKNNSQVMTNFFHQPITIRFDKKTKKASKMSLLKKIFVSLQCETEWKNTISLGAAGNPYRYRLPPPTP